MKFTSSPSMSTLTCIVYHSVMSGKPLLWSMSNHISCQSCFLKSRNCWSRWSECNFTANVVLLLFAVKHLHLQIFIVSNVEYTKKLASLFKWKLKQMQNGKWQNVKCIKSADLVYFSCASAALQHCSCVEGQYYELSN